MLNILCVTNLWRQLLYVTPNYAYWVVKFNWYQRSLFESVALAVYQNPLWDYPYDWKKIMYKFLHTHLFFRFSIEISSFTLNVRYVPIAQPQSQWLLTSRIGSRTEYLRPTYYYLLYSYASSTLKFESCRSSFSVALLYDLLILFGIRAYCFGPSLRVILPSDVWPGAQYHCLP